MTRRAQFTSALALASVVYFLNYDWVYTSLFFNVNPLWRVGVDLLWPLLLVLCIHSISSGIVGASTVVKVSDLLAVDGLALAGYSIFKPYIASGGSLPWWVKLGMALGVLALTLLAVRVVPEATWARLRLAFIFGVAIFFVSPQIVGRIDIQKQLSLSAAFHEPGRGTRANAVVLVLDEWSYTAAAPVISALSAGGRTVHARGVQPSGKHTIGSIPGLLTGHPFDGARACSASALCADAGTFDFSKQRISVPNFNLVGAYHPYCALNGLAYCRQFGVLSFDNGLVGFGCNFATVLSLGHQFEICERQWLTAEKVARSRRAVSESAFIAPFWQTGGVLYIHTLLPHPPGESNGGNLDQDYADNLKLASELARDLLARLEQQFGNDFLLVVTSDHPLRPDVWCATYRYRQDGCLADTGIESTQVPLVAVGRNSASLMTLTDNFGLFEQVLHAQ